jgi:hypothetical protein
MSMFDDTRTVERPTFFDGQQLFAADLDGIVAFHRAMRWLHNRSLHQAGVGTGFAVSGKRGDREVSVQPGYALDLVGRELVLLETQIEPVPPVAGEPGGRPAFFDLVVSYPSDEDLEEAETRAGVCVPRQAVRLRERPVFCWVRLIRDVNARLRPLSEAQALAIQSGLAIVLARAEVLECRLNADLSIAVRRTARPPRQPRLACGTEQAAWEQWPQEEPEPGPELEAGGRAAYGLMAPVDTRKGRFRQTPRYAARVEGTRPLVVAIAGSDDVHAFDLPAFVDDAGPTGFRCHVPIVDFVGSGSLPAPVAQEVIDAARAGWRVSWLGIED